MKSLSNWLIELSLQFLVLIGLIILSCEDYLAGQSETDWDEDLEK